PGRVGDSPIIGAGLYVDNTAGAAGATGRGEEVIRTCGSFLVVEFMRQGKSAQVACEMVCERIAEVNGGIDKVDFNDKFVAISKDGDVGVAALRGSKEGPPRAAFICPDGFKVVDGSWLKPW
ncbi:MAG: isoaspartyl peptidase/L-asparaginase, partial [Saprospiraceae bacterium]|nr:isoaspartyl peptidase/L-asparaginase [Saprospiraceae bacterium]